MADPAPPDGFSDADIIFTKDEALWIKLNADLGDNQAIFQPSMSQGLANLPSGSHATNGIGEFDKLPVELKIDVIMRLDIRSLFRFRDACPDARHFVDTMPEWQMILNEECGLLRTLGRSSLGERISLSELSSVVKHKECARCSKRGDYLALKFWRRLCRGCITDTDPLVSPTERFLRHAMVLGREPGSLEGFWG